VGALIDGDLNCRGGVFEHDDGNSDALTVDRATVGGRVFLSDKFESQGQVRFVGAEVGGQVVCSGGKFSNEGKFAVSFQGMSIGDALIWCKLRSAP